jgi:GDP-L-fucose synthase
MSQFFSLENKDVWVTGHGGMVGSAIYKKLVPKCRNVLTVSKNSLDIRDQSAVLRWFKKHKPDVVIHAAATVGGIHANIRRSAEFIYDNVQMTANIIHGAHLTGVSKLVFIASNCMYPREAQQPIDESSLLTGPLEPTNQWFAIAKVAGVKLCQAYRQQYGNDFNIYVPANLYGPGENFDPAESHVPASLILRFHVAKTLMKQSVPIWGSGTPIRDFLFIDDMADAVLFLLERASESEPINIGTGNGHSISEFASTIAEIVGWKGSLFFDTKKPDGMPKKVLNTDKLANLGWTNRTTLAEGICETYAWFKQNIHLMEEHIETVSKEFNA